ncbi:kinase-like domain-containing protein [Scleroderma yunnanense]
MPAEVTMADSAIFISSLAINSATLAAQAAPVPWLGAAFATLTVLKDMIIKAKANKSALGQLRDRCSAFLSVIEAHGGSAPPEEQKELALDAERTIRGVVERMRPWCSMSAVKLFIKQDEVASEVQDCHSQINDCMTRLQITAALEAQGWQVSFKSNLEDDRRAMLEYLSDTSNVQNIILQTVQQSSKDLKTLMGFMQQNLPNTSGGSNSGLEANLYELHKSSKTMLANMNLKSGEVRRIGKYPVSGTHTMDIWEGIYLNEEKVAIKIIRSVHAGPRSLQRFTREVEIWRSVWEVDQGRHIVPLYGFCQIDGPFPYVVSPWMPHGTVDHYVKQHPDVDHRALIKHIAEGVNLLHTMAPPIVHGDIRGANIVIDGVGNPLLSDFGFSRIIEDITGVAITQSTGILDSQRWAARELCLGGKLTTKADVYSFGMTVLELMTHQKPWPRIRLPHQVVLKVADGAMPPRPLDDLAVDRGLDDRLWELLLRCWDEPEKRPTMAEVLTLL